MKSFLETASHVTPSPRQLEWFNTNFYAFVHFGVNTFTNKEWGDGTEDESIFNPVKLDCDQWVSALKSAGMKAMVLTCKHHDGFCLWPSKYTEHSVKNSPLQRDVVREASEACKRGGIKFGVYLSPWDRNSALYGTEAYNDYFCNQLTELLTEYGDIFCVWFDNACGEGPNGKKQVYDFPRYIKLIRQLQPNAVIFNDFGPDVRWCGNEAGVARTAEWAVVPHELVPYADIQTPPAPLHDLGTLDTYNTDPQSGFMPQIMYSEGLSFCPCEINMSIRPGWFWHKNEEPHSLDRLWKTYLTSVGANASFHLNLPPTNEGLIDERDVARLKEFGALIQKELGNPIPATVKRVDDGTKWQGAWDISFDTADAAVKTIILREDIANGQRIEGFKIYDAEGDPRYPLYFGTTVGNRAICPLKKPFALQNPLTDTSNETVLTLRVEVTSSRGVPTLLSIEAF